MMMMIKSYAETAVKISKVSKKKVGDHSRR